MNGRITDLVSPRPRVTWRRWMRRSMVLPQWTSTNRYPSEIVRNWPLRPLIIYSLSVSQMRPLLPNICQIWVTTLKNSKYSHGNLLAGRSLKRSSPVPSLTAADITGERPPHLFSCILLFTFGIAKAHTTLSFRQLKCPSE